MNIKYYQLIFSLFFCMFISCDTFSGVTIQYNNVNVSINQIYTVLENNLIYDSIELIFVPSEESEVYSGIIPKLTKQYSEAYEYISLRFDTFGGVNIRYINGQENYLFIDSRKLGASDAETMENRIIKLQEIKNILLEYFPEHFNESLFIENIRR